MKTRAMDEPPGAQSVRFVVIHRPGPAWQTGIDFTEQPGVRDHVAHFVAALEAGQLERGGPFVDSSGGMMVFSPGVAETTVAGIARADPAVQSGLLVAEVRPWQAVLTR